MRQPLGVLMLSMGGNSTASFLGLSDIPVFELLLGLSVFAERPLASCVLSFRRAKGSTLNCPHQAQQTAN